MRGAPMMGIGMSYRLTSTRADRFLRFTVTGENTPETVAAYMEEVRALHARDPLPGILIEENLTGRGLGVSDIFSLVVRGVGESWSGLRAMAFVDGNPRHDAADMQSAENVAVNCGVNVRVFPDVAAAREWLAAVIDARS